MEISITERIDVTPSLGIDWMKTFNLRIGKVQLAAYLEQLMRSTTAKRQQLERREKVLHLFQIYLKTTNRNRHKHSTQIGSQPN